MLDLGTQYLGSRLRI